MAKTYLFVFEKSSIKSKKKTKKRPKHILESLFKKPKTY